MSSVPSESNDPSVLSLGANVLQSRLVTPELWGRMMDLASASFDNIVIDMQSGVGALTQVHLLISDRIVGGSPCQVVYFPGNNTLNLINDSGSALVSLTGVTPGTGGFLANSRCQVNTAAASISTSGTNLSVNIPLSFTTATFAGAKNVYGNAFDNTGMTSHWVQGATLLVQ